MKQGSFVCLQLFLSFQTVVPYAAIPPQTGFQGISSRRSSGVFDLLKKVRTIAHNQGNRLRSFAGHVISAEKQHELECDTLSLNMLEAAFSYAKNTVVSAEKKKEDEAKYVSDYYKGWAANVIKDRQAQAAKQAGEPGVRPVVPRRQLSVPSLMDISTTIGAQETFEQMQQAQDQNMMLNDTRISADQMSLFVGLWTMDSEEGLVTAMVATGGTMSLDSSSNSKPCRKIQKWVDIDAKLHVAITGDSELERESTGVEDQINKAILKTNLNELVEHDGWWQEGALVTAATQAGKLVKLSRRFVETSKSSSYIRDRLIQEITVFDIDSGKPISCVRCTFKRVAASDVIGDLRVKTAWRAAQRAAHAKEPVAFELSDDELKASKSLSSLMSQKAKESKGERVQVF